MTFCCWRTQLVNQSKKEQEKEIIFFSFRHLYSYHHHHNHHQLYCRRDHHDHQPATTITSIYVIIPSLLYKEIMNLFNLSPNDNLFLFLSCFVI